MEAGVNYLTAKTIVFFHKKEHPSYQFNFENAKTNFLAEETASYIEYQCPICVDRERSVIRPTVEIVCSTGNIVVSPSQKTSSNHNCGDSFAYLLINIASSNKKSRLNKTYYNRKKIF